MFLLIDNYDSFAFNLKHHLGALGVDVMAARNDALTVKEALALMPTGIVLSPGPRGPDDAGICIDLTLAAAERRLPVFGVCLGFQAIARAFGASVDRAQEPVHGKVSRISHTGHAMFTGVPETFEATRYHSLGVSRESLAHSPLQVTATGPGDEVMALHHTSLPISGVQFHPESVATPAGYRILSAFLIASGVTPNPVPEDKTAA